MSKDKNTFLANCIELIRSDDPMTFEDGYHLVLPKVADYADELVKLIEGENNPRIKSRFIELLGACDDKRFIPLFKGLLTEQADEVISWALSSLENMSSAEGKKIADEFRIKNPKWLE